MFKIDLVVHIDRVDWHVHDGKLINLRSWVVMEGVEETEVVAARALHEAFEQYYKAAHRISSDGP